MPTENFKELAKKDDCHCGKQSERETRQLYWKTQITQNRVQGSILRALQRALGWWYHCDPHFTKESLEA